MATSLPQSREVADIDMEIEMARIQNKLRKTNLFIDPAYPVSKSVLINPDGIEAADYIDNMTEALAKIANLAMNNITDESVKAEITRIYYQAVGVRHDIKC
jgi:hypothetical protein